MLTFDITPDGKNIVFDRSSEDSDTVLIELATPEWPVAEARGVSIRTATSRKSSPWHLDPL
jgi:hypothetical protein